MQTTIVAADTAMDEQGEAVLPAGTVFVAPLARLVNAATQPAPAPARQLSPEPVRERRRYTYD